MPCALGPQLEARRPDESEAEPEVVPAEAGERAVLASYAAATAARHVKPAQGTLGTACMALFVSAIAAREQAIYQSGAMVA